MFPIPQICIKVLKRFFPEPKKTAFPVSLWRYAMKFNEKQKSISQYPEQTERQIKINSLANRIEYCPDSSWASIVCKDCGAIVKKSATKMSCYSPFCQDPECIKNRKRLVFTYLKGFNISSKKVLHIVFGFPHVPKFTKDIKDHHNKVFDKIKLKMKKLGTPLKMIICRDLNGSKGDLYVHYHSLNLPVKDWRKFRQNLFICQKSIGGFSIKFKHYRNKLRMYKYFAKRSAGVFQNEGDKDKDAFGFPKLMNLEEYFDCFYKVRKFKLIGLKPRRKTSVLALLLDNSTLKCPVCGQTHFEIIRNEDLPNPNPPPDLVSVPVKCEIVKFS